MNLKPKKVARTVIFILAFLGLSAGFFVSQHVHFKKKIDPSQFHGTYLEHPRAVNRFVLTGIDNQVFDNISLNGQWTLMFFGFTQCGYLCPTTMAELGKMYRILEKKKVSQLPRVVMVSIDPDRDSLPQLKKYVKTFHPNFYGVRGEEQQLNAMTHEMGIAYAKMAPKDRKNEDVYDVQHSGAIILFNPQGELSAFFTTPHHAKQLATDYQLLIS
jgi:protein SCO1